MEYTYEIIDTGLDKIVLRSDGACIPIDESNSDYQAYLNPVEHLTEIPTQEAQSL